MDALHALPVQGYSHPAGAYLYDALCLLSQVFQLHWRQGRLQLLFCCLAVIYAKHSAARRRPSVMLAIALLQLSPPGCEQVRRHVGRLQGPAGTFRLPACADTLAVISIYGWELLRLPGMAEGEAASLLLAPLLGMLEPSFVPFWEGSVSLTCDCRPLLRLPLLLECICAACRCAEQLRCDMVGCSLDEIGPRTGCSRSMLRSFTCCCMFGWQVWLHSAILPMKFIPEKCWACAGSALRHCTA